MLSKNARTNEALLKYKHGIIIAESDRLKLARPIFQILYHML